MKDGPNAIQGDPDARDQRKRSSVPPPLANAEIRRSRSCSGSIMPMLERGGLTVVRLVVPGIPAAVAPTIGF
jgi:hypothetical protein